MKRAVAIASLLVLAFPLTSISQTTAWVPFSPPGLNFSALFPSTPNASPPSIDKSSDGSVKSTTYLFMSTGGGVVCGVAVSLYTATSDVDAELTANQTNFLKGANATLLTSQRGEFVRGSQKLPDLTFTYEMPQSNYRGTAIVIVAVDGTVMHTYMALAMLPKDTSDTSPIDKFLNSFVFTSTP
jgi:hypothetical protein